MVEIGIIAIGLFSVLFSVIFILSLLKEEKIDEKKLIKIIGEENIKKIKQAKNDEEIKAIIRNLPKKRKTKLKVLMESQDIRDVLKAIHTYILKDKNESL